MKKLLGTSVKHKAAKIVSGWKQLKGWTLLKDWKLELQTGVLVMLAMIMVTVMSGYMDQGPALAEPVSGPASIGDSAAGQNLAAGPRMTVPQNQYSGIIRLHIIANSDSEEDQDLKLKVRNQVLSKVQNHLTDCFAQQMIRSGQDQLDDETRIEITRTYIQEHLDEIEDWAADAMKAERKEYPVEAELGVAWIPEKVYDNIHFPAGNYEALNITIGEGKGQNWWCVIFPPLCLIDCGEEFCEDRLSAVYGDRIVLRSRVLEILKRQKK